MRRPTVILCFLALLLVTSAVYSDAWAEPETIIRFEEIESLEAEYDDSFLTDSMVFVTTSTGIEVSFPVSSEGGLDKKFVH